MTGSPRVVIVGGGFGGLSAARTLSDAAVQLTLVDRRNHHLFQPLLYQVATAALSPGQIAWPIRSLLARQKNVRVLLADARAVDTARRELVLADGRLPFDALILAAGATHSYFGHGEWEPFAIGLKTLEDALEMRRRFLLAFERAEREPDQERRRILLTFVLVGAGPTGAELAGAMAEIARGVLVSDFRSIDPRQARVILVEAGPRVLPTFPEPLSERARRQLQRLGVEVRTGAAVTGVSAEGVDIGNERIAAGTVFWSAGVKASPLAESLGVPLDSAGRVPVLPDLSVPGHPEIFVIGDLANYPHQTGRPLPGVAQVAIQQGRRAAENIGRRLAGQPTRRFHYRNKGNLAVLGRGAAVADLPRLQMSGFPAWLFWCFVHILFLIGVRNRILVLIEWAWAYLRGVRGARLITDPRGVPATGGNPPDGLP
jgi:NADH dehydrogenase